MIDQVFYGYATVKMFACLPLYTTHTSGTCCDSCGECCMDCCDGFCNAWAACCDKACDALCDLCEHPFSFCGLLSGVVNIFRCVCVCVCVCV
jgi:hypothetical protein